MTRIFILEDSQERIEAFKKKNTREWELVFACSAREAINLLEKDLNWDAMFLDHDLGDDLSTDNTGTSVAKFLSTTKVDCPIWLHSMNIVGVCRMQDYLPQAIICPFPTLIKQFG